MEDLRIATVADIEEYEKVPIHERLTCFNTYDMIKQGAAINPEAPAISFFPSGEAYTTPSRITYRNFLAQITRTANLFHDLGVGPGDVITYLLPNLPHTHMCSGGARQAGSSTLSTPC